MTGLVAPETLPPPEGASLHQISSGACTVQRKKIFLLFLMVSAILYIPDVVSMTGFKGSKD